MEKWWIISVLLVVMAMPMGGCATLSGGNSQNWQQNIEQLKDNIFMFSKLAARIALAEADMSSYDVAIVERYLVALQDLLAVPGQPDFTGARALVGKELPSRYHVYGLTIIDILERYLLAADLDVTEDQEAIAAIISAGINGALEAVREFAV